MTEQLITVSDFDHQEQNDLDELVKQWRDKRSRNNLRAAMYDMKNSTRSLISNEVPKVIKKRQYVLGWSASAVDKLARRCNIEGFYDHGGNDLDELGMAEIIRDNRMLSEVNQAGVSGLIHSVSWLITTQGDTQSGEPDVLMLARDATTGTGIWDPRRRALGKFLSITDLDSKGEPTGMVLYRPNFTITLTKKSAGWTVDRREHIYGVPVDPMRYKPRVGRPFGTSRITRGGMSIHLQALAAMIRADINGESYSLPRYVLLGATESAFQNADGTPKPVWQSAWNAVWAVGDDEDQDDPRLARADIKQFHGQSPDPQNQHLRMLAQMYSGETSIPLGELGIVGDSNPTSHEALLASRDDIIATAEQTTTDWDPDVASAATRALQMKNRGNLPADLDVRSRWRPAQHVSRAGAADAGGKVLSQMPWLAETEVGMELVGLTPEQISRAQAERRRAQGRDLLNRLAQRLAPVAAGEPVADQP